jgi:hypothetical protein
MSVVHLAQPGHKGHAENGGSSWILGTNVFPYGIFGTKKKGEGGREGDREWEIVNVIFDGGSPEHVTS